MARMHEILSRPNTDQVLRPSELAQVSPNRQRHRRAFIVARGVENGSVVDFADDEQMLLRQALAEEFYDALGLVADETRPFFVSDEAALYDIQMEADDYVVLAVQHHYGVTLRVPDDFKRPLWQLLDDLRQPKVGDDPAPTDSVDGTGAGHRSLHAHQ
jgi:hypothetical protein